MPCVVAIEVSPEIVTDSLTNTVTERDPVTESESVARMVMVNVSAGVVSPMVRRPVVGLMEIALVSLPRVEVMEEIEKVSSPAPPEDAVVPPLAV
jgi:hypothetical protein